MINLTFVSNFVNMAEVTHSVYSWFERKIHEWKQKDSVYK